MILCVGEILIDQFIDSNGIINKAGGAPFNVALNLAKFGDKVDFFGSVGDDDFGEYLIQVAESKLHHSYVYKLKNHSTTIAKVKIENGERSFAFIRDADAILLIDKFKEINLSNYNVIHFGSLMLSFEYGRKFIREAIKIIRNNSNAKISFDMNFRKDIYDDINEGISYSKEVMNLADIVKLSNDELGLLANISDFQIALNANFKNQDVYLSLGSQGSIFFNPYHFIKASSIKVTPIDTTGAGDAFFSYILHNYEKQNFDHYQVLKEANIVGALTTIKIGATESVPNLNELSKYL